MSVPQIANMAGLQPWLPWPLSAWSWWTQPVRAERLAALRIGLAGCLLIDILTSYRSHLFDFFGAGGLGGSKLFGYYCESPHFHWSLLHGLGDNAALLAAAFWIWVVATALLLVGLRTRMASIVCWALSTSFASANPNIDNAGDTIRGIILFYLMLSPCAAVWSVDRLLWRGGQASAGPVHIWPWPLRLLFVQLVFIYFMNGLYKLTGSDWLSGDSLYYVLGDLTLTRFSIAQLPVPLVLTQVLTWLVLAWELGFPVLVLFRWTRVPALLMGVAFHLGILATMELGGFVPYVLCLYLPLVPWERFRVRRLGERGASAP